MFKRPREVIDLESDDDENAAGSFQTVTTVKQIKPDPYLSVPPSFVQVLQPAGLFSCGSSLGNSLQSGFLSHVPLLKHEPLWAATASLQPYAPPFEVRGNTALPSDEELLNGVLQYPSSSSHVTPAPRGGALNSPLTCAGAGLITPSANQIGTTRSHVGPCTQPTLGESGGVSVKDEPRGSQSLGLGGPQLVPNLLEGAILCVPTPDAEVLQSAVERNLWSGLTLNEQGQDSEAQQRAACTGAQASTQGAKMRGRIPQPTEGPEHRSHGTAYSQGPSLRAFWKVGSLLLKEDGPSSQEPGGPSMDHLRVHPRYLHTNATSHKWVLGAMAELLDNSMDEVRNGATFASVDKLDNPVDKSPMLCFADDGGGMGPDALRFCMSLGYSHKANSKLIGQYGNGFKTSTIRQGADVIVFTCSRGAKGGPPTQSIGLLSLTFLTETHKKEIVVPMVDYQFVQGQLQPFPRHDNAEAWNQNLETILKWCPYKSEGELLAQFSDMGPQGTKILIYNLWETNEGELELDFDKDPHDICLRGGAQEGAKGGGLALAEHVAGQCQYSLRAYASILYLQWPNNFQIIVRGKPVQHCRVVELLKNVEQVMYKPQVAGVLDTSTIVNIGFAKEAPNINLQGFCLYTRNRLIMKFWQVWHSHSSQGRGVVGVLETSFLQPAHDKQDFEHTQLFMRLKQRLISMQREYWGHYAQTVGYQGPVPRVKKAQQAIGLISATPSAPPPSQTATPPHTAATATGTATASGTGRATGPPKPPVLEQKPVVPPPPTVLSPATPGQPQSSPRLSDSPESTAEQLLASHANGSGQELAVASASRDAVNELRVEELQEVFVHGQRELEGKINALHEELKTDQSKSKALSAVEEELVKWQQWSQVTLVRLAELFEENRTLKDLNAQGGLPSQQT